MARRQEESQTAFTRRLAVGVEGLFQAAGVERGLSQSVQRRQQVRVTFDVGS